MTIQKVEIKYKIIIKSELFVVELKHQDPNVYKIKPLCGKGPMHTVNQQQLYNLQKVLGNNLLHPAPDTHLPIMLTCRNRQRSLQLLIPMVPGQKPKVDSASLSTSYEEENHSGVIGNLFNHVTKNYGGKQVRYPYCHVVLHAKIFKSFFCCCVDPNRYYYCKGQLWS